MYTVLDKFKYGTNLLLISPENELKSLRLYEKLDKKFTLLNSRSQDIEIFSSKLKTYEMLKKNIKALKIEKKLKENIQYVSKPEFGTGSTDVVVFKKTIKLKIKNYYTEIL